MRSTMASLTIRNLEEPIKELLRIRAAHRGHSMEEEVRQILRTALLQDKQLPENLAESIQKRFAQLGGVEDLSTKREAMREPPEFE
ncbi:MAG: plasmid stabilization protein [Cyanobacteria bacterium P01_G01_bin.19]